MQKSKCKMTLQARADAEMRRVKAQNMVDEAGIKLSE
jgi:hypothetical protein